MSINKSYILAGALIASSAIAPMANTTTADAASKTLTVTSRVNFRTGPSKNYNKIRKLYKGYKLTYISKSGKWVKVKYNGKTGYVYHSYVSGLGSSSSTQENNNSTSKSASAIVAYAKTKLGKPYVWGAQGPNSFDCTGFTYYVFKQKAGIALPRTSSSQCHYGTYIKKSNLRPGDLVFFDTMGSNNGRVSHAGIYIGSGKFIHASSTQRKVVISDLTTGHYSRAYVNARRVV